MIATVIAPKGLEAARAGTLGLPPCPRIPSDVHPYTFDQAERDVATLGWLSDRELELMTGEDAHGRDRYTVFDSRVGDAVAVGCTAYDAIWEAMSELLPRARR